MADTQSFLSDDDFFELEIMVDETRALASSLVANSHFQDLSGQTQSALLFMIERQLERIYKQIHKKGDSDNDSIQ